nr:MAG TPA: hypothetical protein [Caudoviricetes sp.]
MLLYYSLTLPLRRQRVSAISICKGQPQKCGWPLPLYKEKTPPVLPTPEELR